jgi:hypothetical protein
VAPVTASTVLPLEAVSHAVALTMRRAEPHSSRVRTKLPAPVEIQTAPTLFGVNAPCVVTVVTSKVKLHFPLIVVVPPVPLPPLDVIPPVAVMPPVLLTPPVSTPPVLF